MHITQTHHFALHKRLQVALSQPSWLGFQGELGFVSLISTPLALGPGAISHPTSFCSRVTWQAAFLWAISRRLDAANRNKRWKARCLQRKHHAVRGLGAHGFPGTPYLIFTCLLQWLGTEIICTMSYLHVAKGILLDNLALPLKEPARVSHGLTGHYSYRNLL